MQVDASLKATLKRLKLSGLLPTLIERVAYAQKAKLSPLEFLELTLHDEVERRDRHNLDNRLAKAGFPEPCTFEEFDWDAPITFDRGRVRDLFNLGFLERREDVIFQGPVGAGKTFLATALGHAACRAKRRVLSLRCDNLQMPPYAVPQPEAHGDRGGKCAARARHLRPRRGPAGPATRATLHATASTADPRPFQTLDTAKSLVEHGNVVAQTIRHALNVRDSQVLGGHCRVEAAGVSSRRSEKEDERCA